MLFLILLMSPSNLTHLFLIFHKLKRFITHNSNISFKNQKRKYEHHCNSHVSRQFLLLRLQNRFGFRFFRGRLLTRQGTRLPKGFRPANSYSHLDNTQASRSFRRKQRPFGEIYRLVDHWRS